MITHPPTTVVFVTGAEDPVLSTFIGYLSDMPHMRVRCLSGPPEDLNGVDVVVTRETSLLKDPNPLFEGFVSGGGGWLGLVDLSDAALPPVFGVRPAPAGPVTELRVLFQNREHPLAARLPDALYLQGRYQALEQTSENLDVVLYADWHYQHSPVMVSRRIGDGRTACTTLQAYDDPVFQQILYRTLCHLAGRPFGNRTLGVGLLGYAPSVGKYHGMGVEKTEGLTLSAVCDLSKERLQEAGKDFAGLPTYESVDDFSDDPNVDVVIVATPPSSHAGLCLKMMEAERHVVCEKPLALNRRESDALVKMAEDRKVHLSCHQNRRFDVDYMAIRQAIEEGLIGDLFHMETFVGGFNHPCGYWHSHMPISGGTAYDWGGHYIDWIVSLIPDNITAVTATRQNRVWHDVTNADQERIHIRFAGGQEAEFMHSDIAASRKPKWYLLGTEGAIVGKWRDITTYTIDPLVYYQAHDIPATETVPDLMLYRRHHTGQIVTQQLAAPERQRFPFHRNLADHLLTGEPIAAPLHQSVKVVGVLEAAARSAENGGTVEAPDG
jgi:predicted dehydrogenase